MGSAERGQQQTGGIDHVRMDETDGLPGDPSERPTRGRGQASAAAGTATIPCGRDERRKQHDVDGTDRNRHVPIAQYPELVVRVGV